MQCPAYNNAAQWQAHVKQDACVKWHNTNAQYIAAPIPFQHSCQIEGLKHYSCIFVPSVIYFMLQLAVRTCRVRQGRIMTSTADIRMSSVQFHAVTCIYTNDARRFWTLTTPTTTCCLWWGASGGICHNSTLYCTVPGLLQQ